MAAADTIVHPGMETPPPLITSPSQAEARKRERDIIEWTDRLFEAVTDDRDRDREVRDTMRMIDYLDGKQWTEKSRYARNRPVLNKTRRHFWESVGLLTD